MVPVLAPVLVTLVETKVIWGNLLPLNQRSPVASSALKSVVLPEGRVFVKSVSTDFGSIVAETFDFVTSFGSKVSWMSKLVKRAVYQERPL